jgi:hypothetical protein
MITLSDCSFLNKYHEEEKVILEAMLRKKARYSSDEVSNLFHRVADGALAITIEYFKCQAEKTVTNDYHTYPK